MQSQLSLQLFDPWLDRLETERRTLFTDGMFRRELYAGEILFRQGSSASHLCLITSGRLQAVSMHSSAPFFATGGPGDCAGALLLISGERWPVALSAASDATVELLSAQQFRNVLHKHPALYEHLAISGARRYLQLIQDLSSDM